MNYLSTPMGIQVVIDSTLPRSTMLARNHEGKVLKCFIIKEDGSLLVLDRDELHRAAFTHPRPR